MPDWLTQLEQYIQNDPLNFGIRAGAIFIVVVGSLILGRWLQRMVNRFPVRVEAARAQPGGAPEQRVAQRRSALGRWLGRLAFACVLVAGAVLVVVIVEYGNHDVEPLDLQVALRALLHNAQRIVAVLLLLPLTLGVASFLQRGTLAILNRTHTHPNLKVLAVRVVYVATLIVGGLVILAASGVSLVLTATLLGALTLALSLALQDVLRNVFAGVYLLLERPFIIGDEITVAAFSGQVEDIQLRITSLRAPDGERVLVPNALLFTSAVVNATANQRRRIVLNVTLPAKGIGDLDAIEDRIREALAAVPGVIAELPPQVTLSGTSQGKVSLRVVFWVPAHDPEAVQSAISSGVNRLRQTFADADVAVGDVAPPPA